MLSDDMFFTGMEFALAKALISLVACIDTAALDPNEPPMARACQVIKRTTQYENARGVLRDYVGSDPDAA